MRYSKLIGTGSYLPPARIENKDLVAMLGFRGVATTSDWITARTGIKARHFASAQATTSELGAQACQRALAISGTPSEEIDLIICATSTPDMVFPSTACLIQAAMGIRKCAAFDVQAACSGFIYALTVADAMIRCGSANRALVVGAEVFSRLLDFDDRTTCVLFGDGAGAVLLEASDQPGILSSQLHADGEYASVLNVAGHMAQGKIVGSPFLKMDGPAVFKQAIAALESVAKEVLIKAGRTIMQVDWLIPHQANLRIMQGLAKKLEMSEERLIVTLDQHGNTSAASIPLALDCAIRDGRVLPGQTLLLEGVGGGFTWGAALIDY